MSDQHILDFADALTGLVDQVGYRPAGSAHLTKGDGTGTLVVPTPLNARECYIWTETQDGGRTISIAVLDSNCNIPYENNIAAENVQVDLGRLPNDRTLYIVRQNNFAGLHATGGVTLQEQKLNATGYPSVDRITNLRVNPFDPASMTVQVDGPYLWERPTTGALMRLDSAASDDLSAYIPGAGLHRLVLVYLDLETGSLGYVSGATATASGTLPSPAEFQQTDYLALLPPYYARSLAFLYFYNGQTTITESEILRSYDPRNLFATQAARPAEKLYLYVTYGSI